MSTTDVSGAAALFGNRFVTQTVPTRSFPDTGMSATDAMRLVDLEKLAAGVLLKFGW